MSNRNCTVLSILHCIYVQRKRIFGIFIDQAHTEMVTTNRIAFDARAIAHLPSSNSRWVHTAHHCSIAKKNLLIKPHVSAWAYSFFLSPSHSIINLIQFRSVSLLRRATLLPIRTGVCVCVPECELKSLFFSLSFGACITLWCLRSVCIVVFASLYSVANWRSRLLQF